MLYIGRTSSLRPNKPFNSNEFVFIGVEVEIFSIAAVVLLVEVILVVVFGVEVVSVEVVVIVISSVENVLGFFEMDVIIPWVVDEVDKAISVLVIIALVELAKVVVVDEVDIVVMVLVKSLDSLVVVVILMVVEVESIVVVEVGEAAIRSATVENAVELVNSLVSSVVVIFCI